MECNYNLEEFVKSNAPYLTISDMVDEIGVSFARIKAEFKRLGITPLSKSEQTKNIILEYHDKKTLQEFIKMTGFSERHILNYCRELNVSMLSKSLKEIEQTKNTISQRLGTGWADLGKYDRSERIR